MELAIELLIAAVKALAVVAIVLQLTVLLLWVERKGSALIQNRIGANRANLFGVMPFNTGLVNTMMADPVKMFTKEDFVPAGADHFLHWLAPFLSVWPILITFACIPFGDELRIGDRVIPLQVASLNVGVLYILATISIGVYGVVLAGWASNNRWSLLGGIRGSAQMISYELAMGLSLVAAVMTYGTLDLQEMTRAQGTSLAAWLDFGSPVLDWIPAWGIWFQPLAFLIFLTAGMAESKRVPFDLPESESELISGYYTEYSGGKQATFMFADFAEIVLVSALVTTLFFGGWQVPFLTREGFAFPWGGTLALPHLLIVILQITAFLAKVFFFCWFQILVRWTVPRFRYDQLMQLGWKGLLPLSLINVVLTSVVILLLQ
ncbi:MAG: complex I subunit 1/NuoH family protein [Candidatus Binatia bacterium]